VTFFSVIQPNCQPSELLPAPAPTALQLPRPRAGTRGPSCRAGGGGLSGLTCCRRTRTVCAAPLHQGHPPPPTNFSEQEPALFPNRPHCLHRVRQLGLSPWAGQMQISYVRDGLRCGHGRDSGRDRDHDREDDSDDVHGDY